MIKDKISSIMIILDDDATITVLKDIFSNQKFDMKKDEGFYFARKQLEAVIYKALYKLQKNPDIVFIDIQCPSIDSQKTIEEIKSINNKAYIIAISNNEEIQTLKEVKRIGANSMIVKPISINNIELQIHKFLQSKETS